MPIIPDRPDDGSPIQNLDACDIEVEKKDGTVELYIVASRRLDLRPETQARLPDKVENYLFYLSSDQFREKYGRLPASKKRIVLSLHEGMDAHAPEFLAKVEVWVKDNAAVFRWEHAPETQA